MIIYLQMGKAEVILFAIVLLTCALGVVVRRESEGRTVYREREMTRTTEWLECNASQYESVGVGVLKRQDPLNKTFTSIQEIWEYGAVSANVSSFYSYLIFNIKPTFTVILENQEVVILGNDTIVFKGGRVRVDLTFDWRRKLGYETRYG